MRCHLVLVLAAGAILGLAAGTVFGAMPAFGKTNLLPPGPLSTQGNQIVGTDGKPVRILSVGVFTNVSQKMDRIAAAGFNTIRVEWNNRELVMKMSEIDQMVAAARQAGLKVILDDHYNEGINSPCFAQQSNGLWYDLGGGSDGTDGCRTRGTVTDAKFVSDWRLMAMHYKNNDTVIGYDLWNEPLAYNTAMSTWEAGSNNPDHNIRYMYERVGNAILAIDPAKLIICEGPQNRHAFVDRDLPAPWGDLTLAGKYPVQLSVANKLVYSIHDYPSEIGDFKPDSGPAKVKYMNRAWGYLVVENIAPVWIGEMGANMKTANDRDWAQTLIDYANGRLSDQGGPEFAADQQGIGINWWWAGYDAHSGNQPSGIFNMDGSINTNQQNVYKRFAPGER
jgi:endoglucanase